MKHYLSFLLVLAMFGLTSCSHVKVRKVSSLDNPEKARGVRFYRPAPYLLVTMTETKKGTETSTKVEPKIIQLPDYSEEYIFQPIQRFGSLDAKVTLADGWNMTQYGSIVDPQVDELLTSLGAVGTAAGGLITLFDSDTGDSPEEFRRSGTPPPTPPTITTVTIHLYKLKRSADTLVIDTSSAPVIIKN